MWLVEEEKSHFPFLLMTAALSPDAAVAARALFHKPLADRAWTFRPCGKLFVNDKPHHAELGEFELRLSPLYETHAAVRFGTWCFFLFRLATRDEKTDTISVPAHWTIGAIHAQQFHVFEGIFSQSSQQLEDDFLQHVLETFGTLLEPAVFKAVSGTAGLKIKYILSD